MTFPGPQRDSRPRVRRATSSLGRVLAPLTCAPVMAMASPPEAAPNFDTVAELTQVTVTAASMTETALDDESKPISVVGKSAIQATAPGSIVEAMRDVPGVNFSRAGGRGGQVVVRGVNSNDNKVPLLINGERFRGRNTLEYNIIDPAAVERIEVIRGPAAAIYGAEAMAGMVNVVMRKPPVNFGEFTIGVRPTFLGYASVNHERAGRIEVQGGGHGFDFLIGASKRLADDYETPVGTAFNSRYEDQQFDATLGYSVNRDHRVALRLKHSETVTHRAGGIGAAPGLVAPLADRIAMREDPIREKYVGLSYDGKPGIKGLARIEASVFRRSLTTRIVTEKTPNATSTSTGYRYVDGPLAYGGKLVAISDIVPKTILTGGLDFYHHDWVGSAAAVDGTGTVKSAPRAKNASDATNTGIGTFLLAEHDLLHWLQVSGNLRYDHIRTRSDADVFGPNQAQFADLIRANSDTSNGKWNYALGALAKPLPWLHFAANFGTSYRVPSTGEKFPAGAYGQGYLVPNPGLKPEEGKTYDVSARLRFDRLASNLTYYVSDYTNLIRQTPISYLGLPSLQRNNIGKARISGLEMDLRYDVTRQLALKLIGTYTRGTDLQANQPLPYIAPLTGTLGLHYESGPFYVAADWRLSRRKTRINPRQERQTAGYGVVDVYAGWNLKRLHGALAKTTLRLGIENLFNKAYVNPTTYMAMRNGRGQPLPTTYTNPLVEPGRNVKLMLTSTF